MCPAPKYSDGWHPMNLAICSSDDCEAKTPLTMEKYTNTPGRHLAGGVARVFVASAMSRMRRVTLVIAAAILLLALPAVMSAMTPHEERMWDMLYPERTPASPLVHML